MALFVYHVSVCERDRERGQKMDSIREINKVQTKTVTLSKPAVNAWKYQKTVTVLLLTVGCIWNRSPSVYIAL